MTSNYISRDILYIDNITENRVGMFNLLNNQLCEKTVKIISFE